METTPDQSNSQIPSDQTVQVPPEQVSKKSSSYKPVFLVFIALLFIVAGAVAVGFAVIKKQNTQNPARIIDTGLSNLSEPTTVVSPTSVLPEEQMFDEIVLDDGSSEIASLESELDAL